MLKILNKHNKGSQAKMLLVLSLICFSMSIFRSFYSNSIVFLFLNLNLFLASIPWLLSTFYVISKPIQSKKPFLIVLFFTWILFFPNAPYILTDLFHLKFETNMPIWFDLVLILSFSWTGILFGIYSLLDIENILKNQLKSKIAYFTTTAFLFIASFGVYLGRYLRWNSWNIITDPNTLISDILNRFLHPTEHPRTWGMTLAMGLFLNMVYWSFKLNNNNKNLI